MFYSKIDHKYVKPIMHILKKSLIAQLYNKYENSKYSNNKNSNNRSKFLNRRIQAEIIDIKKQKLGDNPYIITVEIVANIYQICFKFRSVKL